jgi:hypothetical protein
MTMTVGSATLDHTFANTANLATSAAAYVTAWNASADANVSLYTASSSAGTITITEDTATTGALTASGSVTQVVGTDIAVATAAAAGTTGVAAASSNVAVATAAAAGTTGAMSGWTLTSNNGYCLSIKHCSWARYISCSRLACRR